MLRRDTISQDWGKEKNVLSYLFYLNITLEVLGSVILQENEIKGTHIRNKEIKLSFFSDLKNPKNWQKNSRN